MRTVEEAQSLVLNTARPQGAVTLPLSDVQGFVLAEDVASDLDMPPYDKALMDGFAVRSQDLAAGCGVLAVVGEIFAGQAPWPSDRSLSIRDAVRIMTGAPIPPGADAVVMIERTSVPSIPPGAVRLPAIPVQIDEPRLKPGQNIMPRGTEMTCGQKVLSAGTRIRPA